MNIAFNVLHTLKHMREVRSNMCHLMLFWSIFPSFLPIKSDKNGPFFCCLVYFTAAYFCYRISSFFYYLEVDIFVQLSIQSHFMYLYISHAVSNLH